MKEIILTTSLVMGLVIIVSFLFPADAAQDKAIVMNNTIQAELCTVCTDCAHSAYLL